MKKFVQFIVLFFFTLNCFSQENENNDIPPTKEDQIIFDISIPILLNTPNELQQTWGSTSINFNLLKDIPFGKGNVGLATGIAFGWDGYENNLNIETNPINGNGKYEFLADDSTYNSNKLRTLFVDIPIEFRLRTNKNKNGNYFRVYLGAKAGYLLNSFSKHKNEESHQRFYNIQELNKVRYGVTTRIGFANWNIFAYYQLSSLIDGDKNTINEMSDFGHFKLMNPLSIGISFNF